MIEQKIEADFPEPSAWAPRPAGAAAAAGECPTLRVRLPWPLLFRLAVFGQASPVLYTFNAGRKWDMYIALPRYILAFLKLEVKITSG